MRRLLIDEVRHLIKTTGELSGLDLTGINFSEQNLSAVNFRGSNLRGGTCQTQT